MITKKSVVGGIVGAVALAGGIYGADVSNDVIVGNERFDTLSEYKSVRDTTFAEITLKSETLSDGGVSLDLGNEVSFQDFQRMINFVNFEKERCGLTFRDRSFLESATMVKRDCPENLK